MASYEESAATVIGSLVDNSDFSPETSAAIAGLLADLGINVANPGDASVPTQALVPGEAVDPNAVILTANTDLNESDVPNAGQALIMTGDTTANLTFAPDSTITTMVVGSGGNSQVTFETSENVTVQLQGGENDAVTTGAGDDVITIAGGSASVDAGTGNDTVVLQGTSDGGATIQHGEGNLTVAIGADATGAASIDAGTGFDLVQMLDNIANHVFSFIGGKFKMHSDLELTMEGVNVVGFDGDGDGMYNDIAVLATSQQQAILASLYKVALNREAIDGNQSTTQLDGIEFWLDRADEGDFQHTAYSFMNCAEVQEALGGLNDSEYVTKLFNNLGLSAEDTLNGKTVNDYVAQIADNPNQQYGKWDVAIEIAGSAQTSEILGADGSKYVINGYSDTVDDNPAA